MKKIMISTLLAGLSVVALSGCGDDAKEALGNVAEDPGLQGRFEGECGSSDLADLSERNAFMFQLNEFTRTQSLFTSADCQDEGAKIDYKGTFTIDPQAIPETDAGSINIRVEEIKLTVNNEATAKILSAINFCGVKEFPVGKEVTISEPMSEGTCPLMNVPSERYGAYKVDGKNLTLDNNLSSMSETEEGRVKTLNNEIYVKD